jgi:hypothetical protein
MCPHHQYLGKATASAFRTRTRRPNDSYYIFTHIRTLTNYILIIVICQYLGKATASAFRTKTKPQNEPYYIFTHIRTLTNYILIIIKCQYLGKAAKSTINKTIDIINNNEIIFESNQINEYENEMIDVIKEGRVEGRVEGRDKGRENGKNNEETNDNFMVLALLKKAEGLLTSINSVTKYVNPQSSSNVGYSDSKYSDSTLNVHPASITTYVNPGFTSLSGYPGDQIFTFPNPQPGNTVGEMGGSGDVEVNKGHQRY